MSPRTFPGPWRVDNTEGNQFVIMDANDFPLAYVYACSDTALRDKYLTPAEALVIAEAIAQLQNGLGESFTMKRAAGEDNRRSNHEPSMVASASCGALQARCRHLSFTRRTPSEMQRNPFAGFGFSRLVTSRRRADSGTNTRGVLALLKYLMLA